VCGRLDFASLGGRPKRKRREGAAARLLARHKPKLTEPFEQASGRAAAERPPRVLRIDGHLWDCN
jgi:hypothetical protein